MDLKAHLHLLLFTPLILFHNNAAHQPSIKKNMRLLARSFVYWPEGVSCCAHEMAHAVAAKVLLHSPINVHLGAYYEELSKEVQRKAAKSPGISIHGFDFSKGCCFYKTPKSARDIFIINSAGPIMGIVTMLALLKLVDRIPVSSNIVGAILESVKHVIRYEMLHQAVYGLTPFYQSDDGDGYRVWQACGLPKETLARASRADPKKVILNVCFSLLRLKYLYDLISLKAPMKYFFYLHCK